MKKFIPFSIKSKIIFSYLALSILATLLANDLRAQTWTGNTNTDWNIASNWSPEAVPVETSNIIIPGSVSSGNWPVFSSNVVINSINMQPGSHLDVNGFTFTINGQQAYVWFLGATLNNSGAGTGIIINLCTGPAGWSTYLRSLTVNDDITLNLSGSSYLVEGDQPPSSHYYGNATFNISGNMDFYLSYAMSSQFHGDLAINRTVEGNSYLFTGGGQVNGNYSYTNNAGGMTYMGVSGVKTDIGGAINVTSNDPSPGIFEMHRFINHTTGGSISIQNTMGFYLEKDTLQVVSLDISGYGGDEYGRFLNNQVTGDVTISDDPGYSGGWITYIRNNLITGNTSFYCNGTNIFFDADATGTGNIYNGNVTYHAAGGPVYIAYGAALQCSGNLDIIRTSAGLVSAFNAGPSIIGGNFSFYNNTTGITSIGNLDFKTIINGTVNVNAIYTTPDIFQMFRLINQATGGTINVQNSMGFNIQKDTLLVESISITGYTGYEYGRFMNNQITGDVNISSDASYSGGWATYVRNNSITGNSSFTSNGSNIFYDGDVAGSGNFYDGNVTYTATAGPIFIAYGAAMNCTGNFSFNCSSTGTTYLFTTGTSTIGGNLALSCTGTGAVIIGNISANTNITGTVNISSNNSSPNIFEMRRLVNQATGGTIDIKNSIGFNLQKDTLKVTSISITGYSGNEYGRFIENQVNGDVTLSDDPGYSGGWATYIHSNKIVGNTSIFCNGTNAFYDAASINTGNKYTGNVHYTRTGGVLFVATADTNVISGNLVLNSASGIALGILDFSGNTDGTVEQVDNQPISIPTLIISKTEGAGLILNDSLTVTSMVNFTSGNIYTSPGNNLVFNDNTYYLGSSASSHVIGPVTKIGDDAFAFPVGSPVSLNTLAISAPVGNTSRFRAEYKNQNPTSDGYNTGSKAGSFGTAVISKAGYWNVERLSGTTNIALTLGFGSSPYEQYPVMEDLKVAHWNGSQWDDHGNGGTTGTPSNGTVMNSVPITGFSPFTLAGVSSTYFYTCSNPGPGPDGTPVKIGGTGGNPPYSTKLLPDGSYSSDSIFLLANGAAASFKMKDFFGVELDDTVLTAPSSPTIFSSANGTGTVGFKGWRYFVYMLDERNHIMGAIKDNDLTLGSTTMRTCFSASETALSPNGNIFLRRSFTLSGEYSPAGDKGIRFYISDEELDNLMEADPVAFPDGLNSITIMQYTGSRVDSVFNPIPGGNAVIIPNDDILVSDMGNGMYSLDIDVPGLSGFYIGGNNASLSICPGSTITIPSDVTGNSYQWQAGNGIRFSDLSEDDTYSGTGTRELTITNAPGSIYGNCYRCLVDNAEYSQVYTIYINASWEGTAGTAWEDPANWSCNVLPDLGTEVIIRAGKPNYPRLNSDRTVRSVILNPGATLSISEGSSLHISR